MNPSQYFLRPSPIKKTYSWSLSSSTKLAQTKYPILLQFLRTARIRAFASTLTVLSEALARIMQVQKLWRSCLAAQKEEAKRNAMQDIEWKWKRGKWWLNNQFTDMVKRSTSWTLADQILFTIETIIQCSPITMRSTHVNRLHLGLVHFS